MVCTLIITAFSLPGADRIKLTMFSQSLQGGRAASFQAELYYQSVDGRLVTIFGDPLDHVMVTNRHGELLVYDPGENTVYRRQSMEYSSENNLVYFFLHGKTRDLGLRDLGFIQSRTEFEQGLMISRWEAPASLSHLFSHIELVHEDYMPVYAGYYDASGDLVKKVYYSEYEVFPDLILPKLITEFNYLPGGDSIINRVRFSDVRINRQAESNWFDFEIPDDAKVID